MSKSKKSPAKKSAKLDHAAIVKRLTSGESTLIEESKRAGLVPNTPLRNQLREYLGGKAQYSAMIKRSMEARAKKSAKEEPQSTMKKAA